MEQSDSKKDSAASIQLERVKWTKREKTTPDLPFLLSFPQGKPEDLLDQMTFQLMCSPDPHRLGERLLLSRFDGVSFVGTNCDPDIPPLSHQYCIGLYTPESEDKAARVKLVDVSHVYKMQQYVSVAPQENAPSAAGNEYSVKRKALVDQFESEKRKRRYTANAANKVDIGPKTQSAVSEALGGFDEQFAADAGLSEEALIFATKENVLPPFNAAAATPAEIYDPLGIVTIEEMAMLNPKKLDPEKSPEYISSLSGSVAALVTRLKTSKDAKQLARRLLYLDLLIKFATLPRFRKESDVYNLDLTEALAERILDKFTATTAGANGGRDKRVTTGPLEMKLLSHICVLALICGSFTLDKPVLSALMSDLKLPQTKMLQYFREVGCAGATASKVELTAPLKLPALPKAIKKRGKE